LSTSFASVYDAGADARFLPFVHLIEAISMTRSLRIMLPRGATMAMVGAAVSLVACKKSDTAMSDTATMTVTSMTGDTTVRSAAAGTAMSDATILARVAAANQGEVDAGKLAESKATNPDVKAFARMMVTDHGKMLSDGEALAKRINVTPDAAAADSIRAANKAMGDMLAAAPKGATFDTAYVNGQVIGHQNALDMLKSAADAAQNPDLKKALTDAQQPVQSHLDRIKDIQGKMK
jgi:putative membrane protein